ncbi:MAG: ribonuclease HII [Bacteroides sp.]|nr:ribonuclease HII [Prevotella sp.]MCM1469794.1 ribonuclease HII [Bacteroides sp.]
MMMQCGMDEAGRGPLAGPVTAAAVILPDDFPCGILNDSKKLSEKKRISLEALIKERAVAWAVASVDHDVIDRINILQASLLAMKNAFLQMLSLKKIDMHNLEAVADGTFCPDIPCPCRAVVKADTFIPAVMAASVLAKTERDRIMIAYDALYPNYGYRQHKGYPTARHRAICREIGPSPIQRLSFRY